jgi:hypothetical protein
MLADLHGVDRNALQAHIATLPLDELTLFILDCALVRNVRVPAYALDRKPEQLLAAADHYSVALTEGTPNRQRNKSATKVRKLEAVPPEDRTDDPINAERVLRAVLPGIVDEATPPDLQVRAATFEEQRVHQHAT